MMFVYIMRRENGDRKVGISWAPKSRRSELQYQLKIKVVLEREFASGSARSVELAAHRKLRHAGLHVCGEWFSASLDDCEYAILEAIEDVKRKSPSLSDADIQEFFDMRADEFGELREDAVRDLLALAVERAGGQRALARQCGVSVQYISQTLANKITPVGRLCDALGISFDGPRWIAIE